MGEADDLLDDAAGAEDGDLGDEGEDSGGDEEAEDAEEYIHVSQEYWYLERCINILEIPLTIFKREKQISRKMEFDGIYIAEQPEDDDLKGHWDKLAKKRVREKYSETFEFDALSEILGMEK